MYASPQQFGGSKSHETPNLIWADLSTNALVIWAMWRGGSRVPIKRGQYNFDNHEKPRFCPQQHIDDQRERALTKAKLVYY